MVRYALSMPWLFDQLVWFWKDEIYGFWRKTFLQTMLWEAAIWFKTQHYSIQWKGRKVRIKDGVYFKKKKSWARNQFCLFLELKEVRVIEDDIEIKLTRQDRSPLNFWSRYWKRAPQILEGIHTRIYKTIIDDCLKGDVCFLDGLDDQCCKVSRSILRGNRG